MGMFDTLISNDYEVQIKCFYIPMYDVDDKLTYHLGGVMNTYRVGNSAPTKIIYYEYPNEFLIYLQNGHFKEEYEFALFKDTQFKGFYKINDVELKEYKNIFSNVYDYRGRKLKVNSKENILEYLQQLKEEINKNNRNFIDFYKIWCEDISLENQLGELFECLEFNMLSFKNNDDKVENIKNYILDFKKKHKNIYDKFINKYSKIELLLSLEGLADTVDLMD